MKPRIFTPALTVGVLLSIFTISANAATFGVRVVDESGMPVSGASVCFGLHGNYSQFGAQFTDTLGEATVDVPNIPFVVTVSKTRFSGARINEPARGFNLVKQVTLVEGNPGPRCKAGSTLAESEPSHVSIEKIDVRVSGSTVQLTPEASGNPTDYRLSASPDLESVEWRPFDVTVDIPESFATQDVVYLQLRQYAGTQNGWIESVSGVTTVQMPTAEDI